jgi:hypothetical protein
MTVVLVAYATEPGSVKAASWNDGFVRAVSLLSPEIESVWCNVLDPDDQARFREHVRSCDVILAKSNWGWIVDRYVRRHSFLSRKPRAIMVSGIAPRQHWWRTAFYDVIFYQTEWYRNFLPRRKTLVHAYGTNFSLLHPPTEPVEPEWDWLCVGNIRAPKRTEKLLAKTGRRLAIGDLRQSDPSLVQRLRDDGVEVRDYVPLEELRSIYWSSRRVYVPARLDGGGERQIMEATACGTEVVIEPDNPKLAEVLASTAKWTEEYFAEQLRIGLRAALGSRAAR